jgi:hypothetical protein
MNLENRLLSWYPVIASLMFEAATGGQIIRMFREQSALGQETDFHGFLVFYRPSLVGIGGIPSEHQQRN